MSPLEGLTHKAFAAGLAAWRSRRGSQLSLSSWLRPSASTPLRERAGGDEGGDDDGPSRGYMPPATDHAVGVVGAAQGGAADPAGGRGEAAQAAVVIDLCDD